MTVFSRPSSRTISRTSGSRTPFASLLLPSPGTAPSGTSLKVIGAGAYGTSATLTESRKLAVTGTDGKLLQFDPQVTTLIEEDLVNDSYDNTGIWELLVLDATQFPAGIDPAVK